LNANADDCHSSTKFDENEWEQDTKSLADFFKPGPFKRKRAGVEEDFFKPGPFKRRRAGVEED
jgi:hypothetical protein